MIQLGIRPRDAAVERLLLRDGFTREAFIAASGLIKARTPGRRDKADLSISTPLAFGQPARPR